MGAFNSEWLVTDQRGAYAMGTLEGVRSRKYHGFFMGIPGRAELAFLADLEIVCNGVSLWPHLYAGPEGPVYDPNLREQDIVVQAKILEGGVPQWRWKFPDGHLSFQVNAGFPGGIILRFNWVSQKKRTRAILQVRGFFAMRALHSLGGEYWEWHSLGNGESDRAVVVSAKGAEVHQRLRGPWQWRSDPQWNENFHYSEELERGYPANESLYSAGVLEIDLASGAACEWGIAEDPHDLESSQSSVRPLSPRVQDFIVTRPAGVVAGFPWFGEWGRDTFVSLPGIVGPSLDSQPLTSWAQELLIHWGSWIDRAGMLPNLVEKGGQHQWQSADATLWWCHSLAALWAYSLCPPYPFADLRAEFQGLLGRAIQSIREGKHQFLRESPLGLLEVTAPHTTWMDAKAGGVPVTPRVGFLPEINALWFEARCLHWLWSESENDTEIKNLGAQVLQCQEQERPHRIFMHSLPLAPSFVLRDKIGMEQDLVEIAEKFWTPLGLRTLDPHHPHFKARCIGDPLQRDSSYHQGPAWGWLGGQFEIARDRLGPRGKESKHTMFTSGILKDMPIQGHIPELFDAEPPFTPRGAPAQAWSLACMEEAKARRRLKVDSKISKILAQRWLGRSERQRAVRKSSSLG